MATTKRPAKKAAKKGARKPTKTATRKPAAKPPKAAKKAAKKAGKKAAKKSVSVSARRPATKPRTPRDEPMVVSRQPEPYAIHLPFEKYAEFARELTAGSAKAYYHPDKRQIQRFIEDFLLDRHNDAKVLLNCDGDSRPFSSRDRIKVDVDNPRDGRYTISVPSFICEKNGEVDIAYLEAYVEQIKRTGTTEAAWALLGMYFLSRCR